MNSYGTPLRKNRRRLGFSLTEILAVAAILSTVGRTSYVKVKERGTQTQCMNNLRQVGQMLQMYHLSEGKYPDAAFYPKDPWNGNDSIRVILEGRNKNKGVWCCPALPGQLLNRGLTYVYNDGIAGKSRVRNPAKKWVMIEINCVSKNAPQPHPGGFNILFADGHVIAEKRLPRKITEAQQACIKELQELSHGGPQWAATECRHW